MYMVPALKEMVLQYAWQFRRYDVRHLETTTGIPVSVLHPGRRNRDGGPDFLDAKVRIGELEWRGHVEIHRQSSEWLQHGHQHDAKYHNVILHVVYSDDLPGQEIAGIPVLELNGRIPLHLLRTFEQWQQSNMTIPCGQQAGKADPATWMKWKERLLAERLSAKHDLFLALTEQHHGDKEVAAWHLLARYLVTPPNRDAMDVLFSGLDWRQLWKQRDNLFQLEAILLGQAGFLQAPSKDEYTTQLKAEFRFQKQRLGLKPMPVAMWQFLRMRPGAFPTLRLALIAAILHRTHQLYETIATDSLSFISWLSITRLGDYWQQHYRPGIKVEKKPALFGQQWKTALTANVVAPILYAHALNSNKPELLDIAISLMADQAAEKNYKLATWGQVDVIAENLADSQALLHLQDHYCAKKKCLECMIGHKLLGPDPGKPLNKVEEEAFYYA
jgi:hypothetical protein